MPKLRILKTPSKAEYERMLITLEKKGRDGFGILGDGMITALGAAGGALAAGTVAGAAGATSILGITTVASWVGVSVVAATPVGWIAGCAVGGAALTYGVSRLIRNGAIQDARRKNLGENIRKKIDAFQNEAGQINEEERFKKVMGILHSASVNEKISQTDGMAIVNQLQNEIITSSQAVKAIKNALID